MNESIQLVDSHCHLNLLDLAALGGSLEAVVNASKMQGVTHFLCVGVDMATMPDVLALAEQYPNVYASVGVHPSEANDSLDEAQLYAYAQHPKVVAIGETGLDYHYHPESATQQQANFKLHIELARQVNKPLIIHSRSAQADTINIMREMQVQNIKGVMHCFTESLQMAQEAMSMDFYISFSGIITFKNARELQDVVRQVPLSHMLVETDAPFLTPVPYRGKPNSPAYVRFVAEKVADLHETALNEVAKITTKNFFDLFAVAGTP